MANSYGPRVITQDLSFYLDAADANSYPGTGSYWYDLASGIRMTAVTATTPLVTVAGAKCMDFAGNSGYWQSNLGNTNLVDMGGNCSLLMWVYFQEISPRTTIFEKAGTSYNSYQQEIAVTWETDESLSYYSRYSPNYDYAKIESQNVSKNQWHLVALKMSTGRTSATRSGFYSVNGSNWTANYSSRSTTALISSGAIRVGSGYAGTINNGKIACVMCYNKMLDNDEIKINYEALKGRFGK